MKTLENYTKWLSLEISLELNSRRLILTSVMQAFAFVLVFYYGIEHPQGQDWSVFYWLITLMASVSGLSRSFLQTQKGLNLYIYQIIAPKDFFVLRTFSNFIYILMVSLFGAIFLILLYGFTPIPLLPLFTLSIVCSLGFAAIFTFTGAIASASNNAAVLLPLLSIPLLIPLLMVVFTASNELLTANADLTNILQEFALITVLDILYLFSGLFLFPHLWGE